MIRTIQHALICSLFVAGSAFATSDESYNGSQCTGVFGADAAQFTRSEYGTQNLSASAVQWVTCSISRENDASNQDATVTFFADSGTTCYLNQQLPNGTVIFAESNTSTNPTLPTFLVIQSDFIEYSTVALTCSLRPKGVIASYHYEEEFVND